MPSLDAYLARIGYAGAREPTLAVLKAVHQHHAWNVPYENLDVYMQVPVSQDIEAIFAKIVGGGRGGWCYEMNGLLAWALAELGFTVTRQLGGVMRSNRGDEAFGNHLVLKVALDGEDWLADVGLGDGIAEPIPICAGSREFGLEPLGDDVWRYTNAAGAFPADSDFRYRPGHQAFMAPPADEALIDATCSDLQSNPESTFRLNLVCQQMMPDGLKLLLGRVLTIGGQRRLISSATEFGDVLAGEFGLPDAEDIWPAVVARHAELFGDTPVAAIRFGANNPA